MVVYAQNDSRAVLMKNEVKKESHDLNVVPKKEQALESKALRLINEKKGSEGIKKTKIVSTDLPQSVGTVLKTERLKHEKSLEEIARSLRISKRYLEIIEEGTKEDFPERVYALGFVRSYAVYLGLNAEDITKRFKTEVLGDHQQEPLVFLLPEAEVSSPRGMILVISAIVALLCIAGWYFYRHSNDIIVAKEIPAELQKAIHGESQKAPMAEMADSPEQTDGVAQSSQPALVPADAEEIGSAEEDEELDVPASFNTIAPTTENTIRENVERGSEVSAPKVQTESTLLQPEQLNTQAADVQPGSSGASPATPVTETPLSIKLSFVEKCWIEVKDNNQKIIVQKSFHPGDVYTVNAKIGRQLSVGNAGGVKISVNDSNPTVIGGSGIVTRISLDPENLLKYSGPRH